jgi:hypothetical protein
VAYSKLNKLLYTYIDTGFPNSKYLYFRIIMASLLFYNKPIALNKVEHADTRIKFSGDDYSFAAKTNSVILAGVEFAVAAKEYPLVFAQAGGQVVPVALLGLRNEENLFIADDGNWDARYLHALVWRYPFVLAETGEEGQRVVCIDESFTGFSSEDGEALFEDGEATPLLTQAIDFLEEYQKQYIRTERFVKRLSENDLLMPLNAKVDMSDGEQLALTGLLAVDEKKMLQLNDKKALEFYRSGELAWLYAHLISVGTINQLVTRFSNAKQDSGSKKAGESKTKKKRRRKRSSGRW